MTDNARKRRATGENRGPAKRLPAYKRQPDLYFTHVWLDREIYSQVLMFIGWERNKRYSVKMAVRILLELGLKHYVVGQINLANQELQRAKMEGREPIPPSDLIKETIWRKTRRGRPPKA